MRHAPRVLSQLTLVVGLALSGGCSILPQADPADVYRLPTAQNSVPAPNGLPVNWSLRIAKPIASDALNSPNIAVLPQGDLISHYKASRWSDPAPVLLRNRILDAFQRDGRVRLLSTDDSNLQADFELGGELQAFQTEYHGQAAEVVIRFDARLVRGIDQRILASRRFEVHQPISDKQVPGVVAGFGQAGDKLMAQMIGWAVRQGEDSAKR
ncbi:ABC-type transport auxiliary lipoprotein family protein [Pseudomonas sp. MWU13-2100]|uniref:ABC-type transport auxiliary lipoprotein family protein n=1 Tax=Pseudomonas sp. MWU13-2100 TaxID=2935075 RepID=UPI0020101F99|nr:ABC-type transport auxiliary lipoprotein family protein [Pseudomonas sp. MWU13-2100]